DPRVEVALATKKGASKEKPAAAKPRAAAGGGAPKRARAAGRGGAAKTPRKAASKLSAAAERAAIDEREHEQSEEEELAAREADDEGRGAADEDEEGGEAAHDEDGDVVEVVGELVDDGADDGGTAPASVAIASNEAALSRSDPLQAYYREIQRHPLLTPDEEKRLTTEYAKTQDPRLAMRLVTSNLRLVVKLAYEYRRAYKNIMDLIQEGNIGLMQAVKRYDPYRGVKLSSYAAWWIRAYILRFILNNWRLVKLGTTQAQRKLFFNLNKEKAKLSAMGIEPTAGEIARRLSVDEKEVVDMDRRLASGEASLDAPVGDTDGRSVSRLELMPSGSSGPDTALEAREMGELVHDRMERFRETLKGKDVEIFDKRMVAEEPLTLQELGDEFGISRERVRQLEARLMSKLRQYLKEELGDSV
ncbi:MAG TPA: RNA polymerase factor sigma-32, partial [Minicystis sp.]|nr:RNA polymerase factor sigma-32 [Minicystis sp.]